MSRHPLAAILLALVSAVQADEPARPSLANSLSPELLELFRAEMRGLLAGSQAIATALPAADWRAIAATADQMQKSYVLERQLTAAQREELERLPAQFKLLDERFHRGSAKLAQAASQKDPQLVVFYYARLLEDCTQCHAAYAQARFPGFALEPDHAQHQPH